VSSAFDDCMQWLGVRPSDLDRFNIPQQCRLPMTDEDMRTGKRLVRCACLGSPFHGLWAKSPLRPWTIRHKDTTRPPVVVEE
jgi:hypothetical protein